jgi:hypothetical protein
VAAGGIDALSQFQLHPALGPIGASVNFTQANLMMVVAGALVLGCNRPPRCRTKP